ncbi:GNAT family N-acetyltransferase [Spongorhabdus nitratireducens]
MKTKRMKFDSTFIDQSWLQRLGIPAFPETGSYIINPCDYWKRGGEEDLAFLYSSESLTLVSCHPDLRHELGQLQPESLETYRKYRADADRLEVYIDDLDYYLFDHQPDYTPEVEVIELTANRDRNRIEKFIACCDPRDLTTADFDEDSDYFYAAIINGQVAGILAAYCGVEPFESLSIIVLPEFRGTGAAKSLLARLVDEAGHRNRIVRYRTNQENKASIRLCESLGFRQHSRLQIMASLD